MPRVAATVAVLAGAALVAAPGAVAKERVTATIHAPTRCDATPGKRITIAFQLTSFTAAGTPQPFGASGVFVLLRRGGGHAALKRAATATATGRYTARVTIPRGGIRRIDVGLEGTSTTVADGKTRDADVLFRVVGDPCRLAR
jgi:hypothetical protein